MVRRFRLASTGDEHEDEECLFISIPVHYRDDLFGTASYAAHRLDSTWC